jgi:hypothetical protein
MLASTRAALIRLAVLVVIVFVGDRTLAWELGRVLLQSQARYSVLYRGGPPADVVAVGNSRGVNGFYAPALEKELGMKVQNLSYNGLSMGLAEALVHDWVEHHGKPRVLVLEVSNVANVNDVVGELLPYWIYSERLRAIGETEQPRTAAIVGVSHLFVFNCELFLRTLYYMHRSDQDWVNRYRMPSSLLEETRRMPPFELPAQDEGLAALGRIVAFAHEQGIALRLTVTPYLCDYLEHATNYQAWLDRIEKAAGERVWDAGCTDHDVAHFADRLHLNAEGAEALAASFVHDGFFDPLRAVPPRTAVSVVHE